jgi:hypothetical protein
MKRAFLLLLAFGCNRAPDPLAEHRHACAQLAEQKALRAGLSIDDCAKELKARADLADPVRQAEELVDRIARLVAAGKSKPAPAELKDAQLSLQALGRPAVAPTLARLKGSGDADLRLAVAKVLVNLCASDCAAAKYDCIVPALLEGVGDDKPADARREAEKALLRCTGEQFGDDPSAWRRWWAGKEVQLSRAAP